MTNWAPRLVFIAIVFVTIATVLPGIREWLAIDACLDRGAVFDYTAQICRTDVQSLPTRPRGIVRVPDMISLIVSAAAAIVLASLFVGLDRRSKAREAAA